MTVKVRIASQLCNPLAAIKEEKMARAKIIIMELNQKRILKLHQRRGPNSILKKSPPAVSRNSVQTGPKSLVFIGIFEKEELME